MNLASSPKTKWKLIRKALKNFGYSVFIFLLLLGLSVLTSNSQTDVFWKSAEFVILGMVLLVHSVQCARKELQEEELQFVVESYSKLLWQGIDARKHEGSELREIIDAIVRNNVLVKNFNDFSILDFEEALEMFKETASKGLFSQV